jgi:NAD(P)-dependent dehydrogenase (short-subunit alcohol dehydrogenase family)
MQLNGHDTATAPGPPPAQAQTELGNVVVTGAASGLGRAIAEAIAGRGGRPLGLDIGELPAELEGERVDLSDGRAAEQAVRRLAEQAGGLNAVVTAAGTDSCGPIESVSAEDWERVIAVNLVGTAAVIRSAVPYLEQSRGRIVTVASTLGFKAAGDASAYCASKFGVVGLSRALALELAGRVGLTMLVPGGMKTAFFDGREEQYKPPEDAELNDPAAVAEAVVFALSQPSPCEIRELVVCPSTESSWPP